MFLSYVYWHYTYVLQTFLRGIFRGLNFRGFFPELFFFGTEYFTLFLHNTVYYYRKKINYFNAFVDKRLCERCASCQCSCRAFIFLAPKSDTYISKFALYERLYWTIYIYYFNYIIYCYSEVCCLFIQDDSPNNIGMPDHVFSITMILFEFWFLEFVSNILIY